MYVLGFSINLLTLFGLVLAIGIVVDDAIVVLENVERIMTTEKLSPRKAAIKAMGEVTGPVIAIVLVLCAVFIPVAFMGGLVGEMYKAVRRHHRHFCDASPALCSPDADARTVRGSSSSPAIMSRSCRSAFSTVPSSA
ncbi:efflux RND transporter permease subunit [Brucella abortus]|nr:efflux RND transporter permease subunit [Brucella abortus]